MKKIFFIMSSFVLLILIFICIYLYIDLKNYNKKFEEIARNFNCDTEISCIANSIYNQFTIGMTRDEVYKIIIDIDNTQINQIGIEYICRDVDNFCYEYISFFENELSPPVRIAFYYSKDELLIDVQVLLS